MAKKTTIYYFSGTGNSFKIASDLSNGINDSEIIRITYNNLCITANMQSLKIGFVFPVYFRGLPRMMEKFIENLAVSINTYFFAVANFGSNAALAFEQINTMLKSKGAHLNANFGVSMPGSMWFMYYPHPEKDFKDRIKAEPYRCEDIAAKIEKNFENDLPLLNDAANDRKMYAAFKPNDTDNNFWTNENCTGCAVCSKVCPAGNIEIVHGRPAWKHQCEQCLACLHWCPSQAIEYKQDSIGKKRYHHPAVHAQDLFVG